jgi:hypothetical protein
MRVMTDRVSSQTQRLRAGQRLSGNQGASPGVPVQRRGSIVLNAPNLSDRRTPVLRNLEHTLALNRDDETDRLSLPLRCRVEPTHSQSLKLAFRTSWQRETQAAAHIEPQPPSPVRNQSSPTARIPLNRGNFWRSPWTPREGLCLSRLSGGGEGLRIPAHHPRHQRQRMTMHQATVAGLRPPPGTGCAQCPRSRSRRAKDERSTSLLSAVDGRDRTCTVQMTPSERSCAPLFLHPPA